MILVKEYFIYPKDIIFIIMDSLHTRLRHPFKYVDVFHVNKHSYTSVCIFLTDNKMKLHGYIQNHHFIAAIFESYLGH